MNIQQVNSISNRLSLRPPHRDSLEILVHMCEIVSIDLSARGHAQAGVDSERQPWKGINK